MSNALQILSVTEDFSFYFTMAIFVLGIIGNLVNLCVLTSLKIFRSNQCAFYLIVESITNTSQLTILFIINLLPITLGFEPGNVYIAWCKLKNMLPQTLRLISTSMVCLAALDQYFSTNPHPSIRRKSTLQLAHRLTFVAVCIWTLHSIPYGVFYQISSSNICTLNNTALTHYYSFFYYPILHGFFPILASSSLSLFAYRNVRHLVRLQVNVVRRRLDRQLTAMIFVRVVFFILLLLPYTIYRIYSLNITVSKANLYPYAVNQLVFSIMSATSNLNYIVKPFFLFVFYMKWNENVLF
jgi:hypothetical protein